MKRNSGFTLVELMVTISVLSIILSYAVPRFKNAFEQARVNLAAANLQTVWTAQRLYWSENGTFAADLTTLSNAGLLDPVFVASAADPDAKYGIAIDGASVSDTTFIANATRLNSGVWSGTVSIDENGSVTGTVVDASDASVVEAAATY